MTDSDESLLLRWSRRKHEARQAKPEPATPAEVAAKAEPAAAAAPPSPLAEPVRQAVPADSAPAAFDLADLPDIETLTYDSDFSVFLREGVPELIKRQALRKLWTSNPILANLDGLNDYDPKSMTFLIQDLEGAAEPVAEVGRGLRDIVMDEKRARAKRPSGRRQPRSGERRPPPQVGAPVHEPAQEKDAGDDAPNEKPRDDT